jgi:hypothetical protein
MKLTTTQLKIIAKETQKTNSQHRPNEHSTTNTEIKFTKENLIRSPPTLSIDIPHNAPLTSCPRYSTLELD